MKQRNEYIKHTIILYEVPNTSPVNLVTISDRELKNLAKLIDTVVNFRTCLY